MTYKKQIESLNAQIASLQQQIKIIQGKCGHKNVIKKNGSGTGGYCEQDDLYWVDYSCPNCSKTWTEYSK